MSCIVFSAQFGGRDAAAAVMPLFRALKAAANGVSLEGFPFPELAFILRVDGDVNRYGLSGAGNLEIDKSGQYLSIDIGINHDDRDHIRDAITAAILASVDHLRTMKGVGSWDIDFQSLQRSLIDLIYRFQSLTPDW